MKTKEVFKDVPNYEGIYEVSNYGRVRSLERVGTWTRILKPGIDKLGRNNIALSKNGIVKRFRTHQLVAMAFLNHKPNGYKLVVDHIDNNPNNNNLDNLQVITQRENVSKDKVKECSKYVGVHKRKSNGRYRAIIWVDGRNKTLGTFDTELEAHNAYQKELKLINNLK